MKKYRIEGMSCAACSARIEKAVAKLEGVESVAVSLLTNSMGVEGTASEAAVINAVEAAGYGAELIGADKSTSASEPSPSSSREKGDPLLNSETPKLRSRLLRSAAILLVLVYFSMGHMMWGFPAPSIFDNLIFLACFEMALATGVIYINREFFTRGYGSLLHGSPNMDTLVALGSTASFAYSLAELVLMIRANALGDAETVMSYGMNLYFESAAMIPTLITVGKLLEAISKGQTTDALKSLMRLAPKTATLYEDGVEREVPIESVKLGDIFVVKPGGSIPADGVVIEGMSAVDESTLTGESMPVDKAVGNAVSSGTLNQTGYIRCEATRIGEDTTLAQIISMMADLAATKAPLARIADRVSGVFVPIVMGIAAATLAGWLIAGETFGFAIARAITVLVISCPCALGLATPVAIMVGSGVGARNGILYKTAEALERLGKVKIVALDKTGTITEGKPRVTDILPTAELENVAILRDLYRYSAGLSERSVTDGIACEEEAAGNTERKLLAMAAALEAKSDHPLALAITARAREENIVVPELTEFEELAGNGVRAALTIPAGMKFRLSGGSFNYIESQLDLPDEVANAARIFASEGKTPLLFACGDKLLGIIAIRDAIKKDSAEAIATLGEMGLDVVMITGDNERTANAIASEAGIDKVIAGVLPSEKSKAIEMLQSSGAVAMVGDGINDALALTAADVGIAIGAGADVAIDAADAVLMKNSLMDVARAIKLSRATIRNIHENLFWAFVYNAICIPLAIGLLGVEMKPAYGAAMMAMSSFCVCMNALRLNLVKLGGRRSAPPSVLGGHIDDNREEVKEINVMKKIMHIEGMMCPHCEASVRKALEAIDGVESATPDHNANTAVVMLSTDVADEVLRAAVEAREYIVTGIE